MRSRLACILGLIWAVCPLVADAADASVALVNVAFPNDSPVLFVSFSMGDTSAHVLRTSMALDLHSSLVLRNAGTKTISGLTVSVDSEGVSPSGHGSVSVPSLNVKPGEVFPVRIDMELLRPLNAPPPRGSMVQITLDCALFTDLTGYGPDLLGSRRTLIVYEMLARRDRAYLTKLIEAKRWADVREELDFGLQDLTPRQFGLELVHDPRSAAGERPLPIHAVSFPSAPVSAIGGAAQVARNEVRAPQVEVRNGSKKLVQSLDMGWIIRDEHGRDYVAGSTAAAVQLGPVQAQDVRETATLRFSGPQGQPMLIEQLMAFVNDVQFGDGSVWIPSRSDIEKATDDMYLRRALATSPEQQRLAAIFRKRGLEGLIEELRRFN